MHIFLDLIHLIPPKNLYSDRAARRRFIGLLQIRHCLNGSSGNHFAIWWKLEHLTKIRRKQNGKFFPGDIFKYIFLNNIFVVRFKFYRNLFPSFLWTVDQHWFRQWPSAGGKPSVETDITGLIRANVRRHWVSMCYISDVMHILVPYASIHKVSWNKLRCLKYHSFSVQRSVFDNPIST